MEIAREPVESMNCFEAYPLAGFIFARRVKTLRGSLLMPVGERNEEKPLYPALGKRDETLPGKAVMPEAAIETGALLLSPVLWRHGRVSHQENRQTNASNHLEAKRSLVRSNVLPHTDTQAQRDRERRTVLEKFVVQLTRHAARCTG